MRHKYSLTVIVFLLILTNVAHSKKLASLPEVEKPSRIAIGNGYMLISDHTVKLHLYSMKDFSYKLISQKGEGPAELRMVPGISVLADRLFVQNSTRRAVLFSFKGEVLSEYRIRTFSSNYFFPIGKNFVMQKFTDTAKDGSYSNDISIYRYSDDKGFEYKKLIYYKKNEKSKKTDGKMHYPLIRSYFNLIVDENKAFIGDSDRGCYVEIYDSDGQEVGKIRLYLEPIKVTDKEKNAILSVLNESPHWGVVNNMYHVHFPEFYPAFYRFAVDNQKVYFLTYKKKDSRREVIITDFRGDILKRTTVPALDEYGVYINFSVKDDKFYYIKENEDAEEWELHVEEIK